MIGMPRFSSILFLHAALLFVPADAATVGSLRCEQLRDPHGIDTPAPRLSWEVQSETRGDRQTAFRVLVATTTEALAQGHGDVWDSGRVESGASHLVPYDGRKLNSHERCFWKVRVWDRAGEPSDWSEPAVWSMGLLSPAEWHGDWIGLDAPERIGHLSGTSWIWFPEGAPVKSATPGKRYFRREFEVPAGRTMTSATYRITADDRVQIYLNGRDLGGRSGPGSTKELDLTHRLKEGRNVLAARAENAGDAPSPAGLIAWLRVEFAEGEPLTVTSDGAWRASDRLALGWDEPDFDDSAWPRAQVLGPVGIDPWGPVRYAEDRTLPARYVRKEFTIEKPVRRAVVSFSGLGLSELYVNGQRIGDHALSPGLTEYPERSFYVTHEVTDGVQQGGNALGVILGNGRFYAPRSSVYASMPTFGSPKLLLQLSVEHEDGTTSEVVSDLTWKLTADGPITANNEYDGERYDARKELGDWTRPGYDDSSWRDAQPTSAPSETLSAPMSEPIRVTQTLTPLSVSEPQPGVFIYDLGQNMVGYCRLKVEGPAGTRVRLRHAETLKADGTLYLANLRGAKATDVYTLKGGGPEVWSPRFTYHGFRYVEVTGFPGRPPIDAIEGLVVHDDLEPTGKFACSNELLNQIHENVVWGMRGNYRSIPTDCPQRDERQGWLGDRFEVARGESYLFDVGAFYAKWVQDIRDSQKPSGSVPDVSPAHWPNYSDDVVWPSASVILPDMLIDQYGNRRVAREHYASMNRWIEYMLPFVHEGLISRDSYGDWCVPPEDPHVIHSQDPERTTDKTLLASTFFCHDLRLMERYAQEIGHADDAERWKRLADEIQAAVNAKFLDRERGQYDNGTQTSCVLPLAFGMVPDGLRGRVVNTLATNITDQNDGHIATGLVGGQLLCRALNDAGRADLAYTIATQRDYPSWGYMVGRGATTMWELWNGDTADPAMNSRNHVMLVGDLITWLYEDLGGIAPHPAAPGFKRILMRPQLVDGLDWVNAAHRSPYGWIESHWWKEDGRVKWNVTIPANATAELHLPASDGAAVTESGTPLADADGLEPIGRDNSRVVVRAESGAYVFEIVEP